MTRIDIPDQIRIELACYNDVCPFLLSTIGDRDQIGRLVAWLTG